jgi:3-oxoadipate enol-lactonase
MPEVVVNGTRLHYQQHGSVGPNVVMLHAVTSNLAVWLFTGLVDALAVDHRVTLFDFRGHGASERPATGYTSADMADDFAGLHRELGLGPAYLVGHSFGGVVGLHAAVLYPECVAGVVLSDSFFPGLKEIEPNFGRANVWEDLCATYRRLDVDLGPTIDFTRLFRTTAELSASQLKALEELVGPFGKGWLRQLPRLAETTCGDDVLAEAGLTAGQIAGVTCPVVALYDEFSPFQATCRWLEKNVPDCTAEIIPAAKHLALVENPAGFTDAVRRHLNRLTGKAA